MRKELLKNSLILFTIYILIGIFLIYNIPVNYATYKSEYCILVIVYFTIVGLNILTHLIKKIDLFEPIVFITFLYVMIFCIVPAIDIINNETLVLGVNVMGGCKKATTIFTISYLFFYAGYYFQRTKYNNYTKIFIDNQESYIDNYIVKASIIMWSICYLINILTLLGSGNSMGYIITGGILGDVNISNATEMSLGFLGMFSYSLIPLWMYIYVYGKNKIIKLLLAFLTITSYIIRGYRFIIIILLFAPIIFSHIKNNKKIKFSTWIIIFMITILMIGVIEFARDNIRSGSYIDWQEFNIDMVFDTINGNFGIYKPFYGLVQSVPELHGYTFGQQFIYTFILIIPRLIWKNKPYPIHPKLISVSVNEYAAKAGVAWPNLGEYYSEFGVVGTIIFMFIFGKICGMTKKLYKGYNVTNHSLIAYSIILPTLLQLVIRGYTPTNFYLIIFLMIPILLINKITIFMKGK